MANEIIYRRSFQKAVAVLSFGCFIFSLAIHSFAVFGINVVRNDSFNFFFHALMFIPFGVMVAVSQPQFKVYKSTVSDNYQKWFFSPMPKWIKYAVYIFGIYVFLNFFFCLTLTSTVKAEKLDGKYVLLPIKSEVSSKNVIKEISEQEYELQSSYEIRLSSGHWMLFYLMPALFLWYEREKPNWIAS